MSTEGRIARFLVNLSEQMAANGYSPREFTLKMTREDIANHLGMTIETVCRTFGRMQTASLLNVSRRNLEIRNLDALRKVGSV
ncbi:Fumarate and nitrate reduction regulatory protein [compost metagenome]